MRRGQTAVRRETKKLAKPKLKQSSRFAEYNIGIYFVRTESARDRTLRSEALAASGAIWTRCEPPWCRGNAGEVVPSGPRPFCYGRGRRVTTLAFLSQEL